MTTVFEESAKEISLWSFHRREPKFSLLHGRVDPKLSSYDDPGIVAAYAKLNRELGTDQIIWCYTRKESFRETSCLMVEWALQVPIASVLRFYDSVVWARIIGQKQFTPPEDQRRRIGAEARQRFPYDFQKRRQFESTLLEKFWNEPAPEGGWWGRLFVEHANRDGIDALLRHPIEHSWSRGTKLRGFSSVSD